MKIEVTNLVEFDEVAERARIEKNFSGGVRETLIDLLDEFVTQRFDACMTTLVAMPKEWREFMHPVVSDTLQAMRMRDHRRAALDSDSMARIPATTRTLADIAGRPMGRDGLDYPKFNIISK